MKTKFKQVSPLSIVYGGLALLLIGLVVVTLYFWRHTQAIYTELEGARNLVSFQSDRSDRLDLRLATLEENSRGNKNCNFTTEQALAWDYTHVLVLTAGRRLSQIPQAMSLNVPNQWCEEWGKGSYFYIDGKKYYFTINLDNATYEEPELLVAKRAPLESEDYYLDSQNTLGSQPKTFSLPLLEESPLVFQLALPVTGRNEFLTLFNRILRSARPASAEEIERASASTRY